MRKDKVSIVILYRQKNGTKKLPNKGIRIL